jgi:hypothetical protein
MGSIVVTSSEALCHCQYSWALSWWTLYVTVTCEKVVWYNAKLSVPRTPCTGRDAALFTCKTNLALSDVGAECTPLKCRDRF